MYHLLSQNSEIALELNALRTTTYTHDALGNLTEVILPNNDEISYIYDGRNRLISKQVNGIVEYRLIYGGQLAPVAKVDGSGNTIETYIYGFGLNSPDYILKDGTKYRVIKDHLGSSRMIVDSSTGEIVKTLRYSEFGEITEETGTFETIFGFAGGIIDTDTDLTKFGARWYDASTGRWMEKEPLGFAGSDNFYSYCDGDPVNFVDVTGLAQDRASQGVDVASYFVKKFINLYDLYKKAQEDTKHTSPANKLKYKGIFTPQEKFRHCYGSCMMALDEGSELAKLAGDLKELWDNDICRKSDEDSAFDQKNNLAGREKAMLSTSYSDCYSSCMEYAK